MVNHQFPKKSRLRRTAEFQKVYAAKNITSDPCLICFALPNKLGSHRLGLSVSKKIGNAVVRNRWKRLLREGFRKAKNSIPSIPSGFDFVLLPQKNADVRTIRNLEISLQKLMRKNADRILHPQPTVLITRPQHQAEPLRSDLVALGYNVLLQPVMDILPPLSWTETDNAIRQFQQGEFDWLIFSSVNGVHAFFDRIADTKAGAGSSVRIAAVGNATAAALLERTGKHADLVPHTFSAEFVAASLAEEAASGKRFLHLRGDRGSDLLRQTLTDCGGDVREVHVYRSADRTEADPRIAVLVRKGKIDFVTVTSSAIAKSLAALFGEGLRQTKLVSISPLTSQTLYDLGFSPQFEAAEATMHGITEVLRTVRHSLSPYPS